MGVKQLKVDSSEVSVGMFVSGLDRPWSQTPFPVQGFYVRDAEEVRQLKNYCKFVYIDISRGSGPLVNRLNRLQREMASRQPRASRTSRVRVEVAALRVQRGRYPLTSSLKSEFVEARRIYPQVEQALAEVVRQVAAANPLPAAELRRLAGEMSASVLRHPDALTWMSRLAGNKTGDLGPSLRAAVWALLLGRHLGLGHKELDSLAFGVLLKDVGKLKINPALLDQPERSAAEERQYEQFVEFSAELLRQTPEVEPRVVSVVKSHCERVNGSGYPQQLKGDKIPLLARIAGIVSYYDEIVYPPGQSLPLSPARAVARLYECRDKEFQEELVVEFIRAIGLYPTGTLVELNTGEVAVVVEQNFERRLKPRVMVVLDPQRQPLARGLFVDLAEDDRTKQALVDSGRKRLDEVDKLEIVQDLEPGSVAVDIAQVQQQYLQGMADKKKGFLDFLRRARA